MVLRRSGIWALLIHLNGGHREGIFLFLYFSFFIFVYCTSSDFFDLPDMTDGYNICL